MSLLDRLMNWLPGISVLMNLFIMVFLMAMGTKFVSREEYKRMKATIESQDGLIASLDFKVKFMEAAIKQLPDIDKLHSINLQMATFDGQLKNVMTRFENFVDLGERLQRQVDIMDDYLRRRT